MHLDMICYICKNVEVQVGGTMIYRDGIIIYMLINSRLSKEKIHQE